LQNTFDENGNLNVQMIEFVLFALHERLSKMFLASNLEYCIIFCFLTLIHLLFESEDDEEDDVNRCEDSMCRWKHDVLVAFFAFV